ncbi:hypothetical protein ABT354_19840 [Streptomyces sp. NPDC000594]|uniref:hypothetical protein n=1 Tax=Streptomyces sp. NPDC000594 TaxID=3154261 RepID=UPI00331D1913
MSTSASAAAAPHAPGAPMLGQLVFEPPRVTAPVTRGGWWAFFFCHCCGEERYEPAVPLPLDAPVDSLTAHAARFWGRPCLLRRFRDGFIVHPAEAGP